MQVCIAECRRRKDHAWLLVYDRLRLVNGHVYLLGAVANQVPVTKIYDLKTAGEGGGWGEDQARFDRQLALRFLKYVGCRVVFIQTFTIPKSFY